MADKFSIEILRQILAYDPLTGILTWKHRPREFFKDDRSWKSWNSHFAGELAFTSLTKRGYFHGHIFSKNYLAHIVAFALHTGAWPEDEIDHDNQIKKDNRFENLKEANGLSNAKNKPRYKSNASGVTGVFWDKKQLKWRAQITVNYKNIHLGFFAEIEKAAKARMAAKELHGFHKNHGNGAMVSA